MKALVLGASGHIGNAVTRELLARGHEVTATSRRPKPAKNLEDLAVHYLSGDLNNRGQLDAWIEGHDVVVDAAAPYPYRLLGGTRVAEKNPLEYVTLRMHNLLDSIKKHRVTLAYVSSFTTRIHKRSRIGQLPSLIVRQLHPYFEAKEMMESEVLAAARSGVSTILINPTLCLGPWDLKPREYCFIPALLRRELATVINQVLNVIDVRDVARGLAAALETGRYGEPILLAGHNISNEALFQWICEVGGVTPPRIVAPAWLSVIATYWMEIGAEMAGLRPPVPALAAMLTYVHDWLAPSPVQAQLGIVPRPLSATIVDSIRWYTAIGYC